ncbi:hypothetical protein [Curtanaerobium respiraculi]|uniref:hypothetical protein n=1 Tax=Curtanaerobium respiraculi TaxID=2949669 RepID=UPI0024B36CDF|nr:hypothetical protein [Curtanaerobium respiraculi]
MGVVAFLPAIIGGIAGLFSGLVATLILRALDNRGKIQAFYSPRFEEQGLTYSADAMLVPMRVEFFNTAKSARQIRDCCLYIHFDNETTIRFDRVHRADKETRKADDVRTYERQDLKYSFVLPPSGMTERYFEFSVGIPTGLRDTGFKGTVSLSYTDERGDRMAASFFSVEEVDSRIVPDLREGYRELRFKKVKTR